MSTANLWVSSPTIQGLTIGQLVVPGTHDSATFALPVNAQPSDLSQIDYGDVQFLWTLNPGSAPTNGVATWANPAPTITGLLYPLTGNSTYLGPEMYSLVMKIAYNMSRSQDQNILEQLNAGIRYFDLRVYWDSTQNAFMLQHALMCGSFASALQDVQTFISQNATSNELIILAISHSNIQTNSSNAVALVNLISQFLGDSVYPPPDTTGDQFLALTDVPLSQIVGIQPKVIILNGDADFVTYGTPIFDTQGYTPCPNTTNGTNILSDLTSSAQQTLAALTPGQLGRLSWCLTAQPQDALIEAVNQLSGIQNPIPALLRLGTEANQALPGFLGSPNTEGIGCITVDWFDQTGSATQNVVQLAIAMNEQRA